MHGSSPVQTDLKTPRPGKLRTTFSAFGHRNYRLWFAGQTVSLVGTWMQSTAQSYFIYELTGENVYLGYIGFAAGLPAWLFMLYGGVIADRIPRRKLLVITQAAMMVLALVLAGLTFTELVQPWHILILAFLLGTANAFDAPARLAFVTEMVEKEDLTNAIALNATMFNLATAFGPMAGGVTYALLGPGWCFAVNGLSFIAVIASLLMMQMKPFTPKPRTRSGIREVFEGASYVARHEHIRVLIAGLAMMGMFGLGFITLFPAWAKDILGGNEVTNGLLQSARGIGALVGALMIASMGSLNRRGRLLTTGIFVFAIFTFAYSFVRWLPLSLLMLLVVGWGFIVVNNMTNSLVQTLVDDNLRGRVMGFYTLAFFGMAPVGTMLVGFLADHLSEPVTLMITSTTMFLYAGFVYIFFPKIRELR